MSIDFFSRLYTMNFVNVCASTKKPDSWVPAERQGAHTPGIQQSGFFSSGLTAIDAIDNQPAWARCDGNTGYPLTRKRRSSVYASDLQEPAKQVRVVRDESHPSGKPSAKHGAGPGFYPHPWMDVA